MCVATTEPGSLPDTFPKSVVKAQHAFALRHNSGICASVQAERGRKRKQAYNMVNARMLKELQSLAPWTWDKVLSFHAAPVPRSLFLPATASSCLHVARISSCLQLCRDELAHGLLVCLPCTVEV